MNMEIYKKRNELLIKSLCLRNSSNGIGYKKGEELRKEQDKAYKKWKFFDGFIKELNK